MSQLLLLALFVLLFLALLSIFRKFFAWSLRINELINELKEIKTIIKNQKNEH